MLATLKTDCNDLSKELKNFSENLCKKIVFKHDNDRDKLSICLYVKIINIFNGFIVLIDKKLYQPAEQLLRCMIEATCLLNLNVNNENFIDRYIAYENTYQELERLKILKILNISLPNENIDIFIKELKAEIKSKDLKPIKISEILTESGRFEEFQSAYFELSESIHSNPKELGRSLVSDNNGNIIGAQIQLNLTEIEIILRIITANLAMIRTIESINYYFNTKESEKINKFVNQCRINNDLFKIISGNKFS